VEFQQQHPKETRAILNCVAWTSAAGGWKIDLIDTRGVRGMWVLKADLGAALICDCHCDWGPACPGVVSVPAGSVPPPAAPPPPMQTPELVPVPSTAPADRTGTTWSDRSREQTASAAEPATTASELQVPDGWRWPSSVPATSDPSEMDRGELHAHRETEEGWLSLPAPEPRPPVARLQRLGVFGALFGRRPEEPVPAVEHQPAVPFEMKWPATYPTGATLPVLSEPGEPYGEPLYSPEPEPSAEIVGTEANPGLLAGWLRGRRFDPSDLLPAPDTHFAALEPPPVADSYALDHPFENHSSDPADWRGGQEEQLSTSSDISKFLDDIYNAPLPALQPYDEVSDEPVPSLPAPDETTDQN
jgi:hypothetical protein